MSKVYQKLGLLGKTYWHDDGLFVKKITKAKYDEIVIRSQVAQEMARQVERQNKQKMDKVMRKYATSTQVGHTEK